MKCDVLILGGGSAGIAAAVTAARAGAHTLLVERHGSLGGMASAALIHSVCGLYLLRDEPGAVMAHWGFPAEFAERLIAAGVSQGPVRMGKVDVLPHAPPGFAAVADAITKETPGLNVRLHSELIDVRGRSRVESVEIICRGTRETIEPIVVVDASGDAALAAMAGAKVEFADAARLQRPAFIFAMHTVEVAPLGDEGRVKLAHQIVMAVRAGELPAGALGAQFRTTGRGSEVYVTIDLSAPSDYSPLNPVHLTGLEQEGRALAYALWRYLRKSHAAFASAELAAFPTRVGVRESRRVCGEATVTAQDVLTGGENPDRVALGTWPMELREKATGPKWRYPEANRPTQIPLGALKAAGMENLWVAGRCISCEHEAQAAIRVIGTCMATGQAAGVAAAYEAAKGTVPTAQQVRQFLKIEEA